MVKILKYIKFIFCITIIVSLVVPSYAALNSTDGSIFVTKAEFDTKLSDFNKRMSVFTTGINSKIDSQVSSYIEKHGIWSGKKQAIDATVSSQTFNVKDLKTFTNEHRTYEVFKTKIIDNLNKSGLCYVEWSYNCPAPVTSYQSCQGMRLYAGANTTTAHNAWNFDLVYTQKGDTKLVQSIAKCNCIRGRGRIGTYAQDEYGMFWYIPKNDYKGTSMMFVNRDSDLTVVLQLSYYLCDGTWMANESSNCMFKFNSAVVY